MINLNQFKEKIDTEFAQNRSSLSIQAIRIDAQKESLKKQAIKVKKKYKAEATKVIYDELSTKYKDSLLLVNKIADTKKLNFTERFDKKKFFIVTNVFSNPEPTDVVALDNSKTSLRTKLKTGLNCVVDEVEIFNPKKLVDYFKSR